MFVFINLIVDTLYAYLDPTNSTRVRRPMTATETSPDELQLVAAESLTTASPPKGLWRETFERLLRQAVSGCCLVMLGILILCAIFAPWIATHDPLAVLLDTPEEGVVKRMAPCIHLFGCPKAGDELLSVQTEHALTAATLSSTNAMMAAADGETVTIWSVDDGKQMMTLANPAPITAQDWSPNDQKVLAASATELYVWDVNRSALTQTLPLEGGADQVQWNADATRFLTVNGADIHLWDATTYGSGCGHVG